MRHELQSPDERAKDALDRVNDIKENFRNVRDLLKLQIAHIGPPTESTPKPLLNKLSELHTLLTAIVNAEEAFHEKYEKGADDEAAYDEIRDQIGSALDRIRRAEGAGDFSAGAEQSRD